MPFEIIGQIQDGLLQQFLLAQQESDEKPSYATVAVKKRVDGFELGMGQPNPDESREISRLAEKQFQLP